MKRTLKDESADELLKRREEAEQKAAQADQAIDAMVRRSIERHGP